MVLYNNRVHKLQVLVCVNTVYVRRFVVFADNFFKKLALNLIAS